MTNTPYKKTLLPASFAPASSLALSDPSELQRPPAARAARAQDTVLGGRRVLVDRDMGGSDEWLVDNTATGGVTQGKPTETDWRTTTEVHTEMMPGQVLVARALAVPSGMSEIFDAGSGTWGSDGILGFTRFIVTWDNQAADTATKTLQWNLPPTEDDDGAELLGAGAAWSKIQHFVHPVLRPPDASLDLEEQQKWSEYPTISVKIQDRGGARVIHATLSEEVLEHVQDHDQAETSCNGVAPSLNWPNLRPAEEDLDGATYDEQRYGIHQQMRVATTQTRKIGPRICHWSSYAEGLAGVTDLDPDPKQITSATFVRVSAGANTAWDEDAIGFDMPPGSQRAPEHLRLVGAAVQQVRVRVHARYNQAGANVGSFKVQSSPRSLVAIEIDQAVVGTTWTWLTITGWLECAVATDDGYPVLQDFALTSGDTLEIRYWDVTTGDFEVGA